MSVAYKDYYGALGVERAANAAAIKQAFRRLARELHPDVNPASDAAERFRDVQEAYEVLGDPLRRAVYDGLGTKWADGQDFTPPSPTAETETPPEPPTVDREAEAGESARGFSDFFQALFGAAADRTRVWRAKARRAKAPPEPEDFEADITVSLEGIARRAGKHVTLRVPRPGPDGEVRLTPCKFDVRIPAGATDGTRIRLPGQGLKKADGTTAGHLYLRLHVAPHPRFRVMGHDLEADLPLSPWEACLGARIDVPTLDGTVRVNVPPGAQGGRRLRLAGKGLPRRADAPAGDLFLLTRIAIPATLSAREKELLERLLKESRFRPRED